MTTSLPERIGAVVRKRREALGLSQEAFADRIGMHRNYYGAIERGEKTMRLDTFERVAMGLEIEAWRLLKDGAG
ncbi:helix-turn-helix transcriptional regulator [Thermomonas brevis]|uniref:Helix-turn-helix transcriptional regulator n=1 Tax=Thermomonas brevis TaxID=215691 RepID=A0A7G9QXB2_9GAMM|nr:helix-turn-helix transcriptional regulator [Thermomonas brevis]QNN47987.1 helix-turn-helix transcriptional regulator [Thermomonas brevis]